MRVGPVEVHLARPRGSDEEIAVLSAAHLRAHRGVWRGAIAGGVSALLIITILVVLAHDGVLSHVSSSFGATASLLLFTLLLMVLGIAASARGQIGPDRYAEALFQFCDSRCGEEAWESQPHPGLWIGFAPTPESDRLAIAFDERDIPGKPDRLADSVLYRFRQAGWRVDTIERRETSSPAIGLEFDIQRTIRLERVRIPPVLLPDDFPAPL